jgi:hypothetical protein
MIECRWMARIFSLVHLADGNGKVFFCSTPLCFLWPFCLPRFLRVPGRSRMGWYFFEARISQVGVWCRNHALRTKILDLLVKQCLP